MKYTKKKKKLQKKDKTHLTYTSRLSSFRWGLMRLFFLLYLLRCLWWICWRSRLAGAVTGGRRWRPRRWVDSAVDTGRALPLDPTFDVVLAVTHDSPTWTEPSNHAGDNAENGDHCKNGDDGSDRPVTGMGCVSLLGQTPRRWLLLLKWVYRCRHVNEPRNKLETFSVLFGRTEKNM